VKLPFFTIGHSNRSLEEFIELLIGAHINLVADIRTVSEVEPIRSSTRIRFPTLWWPSTSPMSTWQHSAVFAGRRNLRQRRHLLRNAASELMKVDRVDPLGKLSRKR